MAVGFAFDPFCLKHDTGPSHPERPERIEAIASALRDAGLVKRLVPIEAEFAPLDLVERVHEPAYVALLRMACEQGMSFIGASDTQICAESFDAARMAAGAVIVACDAMMAGRIDRAFCAVRPPGHHAGPDQAGGYCLLNNIAIAAEHLRRRHRLPRVAIVDWDVHHGNGTQRIFETRDDVLFVSLHESPATAYPHTGQAAERGTGPGDGFTLNIPMKPGSGDAEYRRAFAGQVIPALDAFAPSVVLVSAGFDAAADDNTANINLVPESFAWMTRELAAVADRHCADRRRAGHYGAAHHGAGRHGAGRHGVGRLISVLEGGYDLASLGRCMLRHVSVLLESGADGTKQGGKPRP